MKFKSIPFAPIIFGLAAWLLLPISSSFATDRSDMVLIPEGIYMMGSMKSLRELDPVSILQADRHMLGPEDPAHDVFLNAFYIDVYEVTNAKYKKFMEANAKAKKPRYWDDPKFNQPNQPVVGINWKEAQSFCHWQGKRLPTEAEWEKASRGKRGINYPWGDELPDSSRLNFDNEKGKPVAVGSYEAGKSDFGVYDLSGNVAEWVQDWHFPEYYLYSPKENPQGPEKGQYKIIRGGNWRNNADDVRLTYRNATVPKIRNNMIGFRCATDVATSQK